MIGQSVGHYRILEKLNEGGMGAVYKALDTVLDREVAIKVLKPELARQMTVIERFRTEALTLAKLNHPNIATLHSFFDHENELFMILEFVPGETLDKVLQRRAALSCEEAIPIFNELLDSIDHAHEFGVIHRDIKPANIMLTEKGTLKVLDFGIARLNGRAKITRVGNILGTLEYMSPEQAKGEETDVRSDIYSLGMTLYEILTGKTPFETENDFELIQKQITEIPIQPRVINPNIPGKIEAAIIKAYSKNPDERFQTAGEFRLALLDTYAEITGKAGKTVPSFPESFAINSSVFGASENAILKPNIPLMSVDSPETPTVEILRENRFYVSLNNLSDEKGDVEKNRSIQNHLPANRDLKPAESAHIQPSFLSNSSPKRVGAAIVGIFVLFSSLAGALFIFFDNEKSQPETVNGQTQLKTENMAIVEPEPEIETKTEIKTETGAVEPKGGGAAAQFNLPPNVRSAAANQPARQTAVRSAPVTAAKPRDAVNTKKKEVRPSEAVMLRRAEKILTGK
jgi:serine/threonine protein kinase